MRWILSLATVVSALPTVTQVEGAITITFDEQAAVSNLGSSLPQLAVDGVTFTPDGDAGSSVLLVTPRTTFDDRSPSPYPYDFIAGNLLQVSRTELWVGFSQPVSSFGFGAALNLTSSPGQMQIDLFDSNEGILGTFYLLLDQTQISQQGGMNSNSEGLFFVGGIPGISRALITNFGDSILDGSKFGFVVDNITFQPVPEPSPLLLFLVGLLLATRRRLERKGTGK
jgi:hypothetical protein